MYINKHSVRPTEPDMAQEMQLCCIDCEICGKPVQLGARAASVKEVNSVYHSFAHMSRYTKNFFFGWRAEQGELMRALKRLQQMDPAQWRELVQLPAVHHVETYVYILKRCREWVLQGPPSESQLATFYRDLYNVVGKAVEQRQPVWESSGTTMRDGYHFAPGTGTAEPWLRDLLDVKQTGTTKFADSSRTLRYQNEYMRTYEARNVVSNTRAADHATRMFRILANLPFYLNIVTHEASWVYLAMLYRYLAIIINGTNGAGSDAAAASDAPHT